MSIFLFQVKGVTFCGKSDASNLNMTNTPWHHEVVELKKNLQKELMKMREEESDSKIPEYGLACEHKHSCSVLLARVDQFAVDDPKTGRRKWKGQAGPGILRTPSPVRMRCTTGARQRASGGTCILLPDLPGGSREEN